MAKEIQLENLHKEYDTGSSTIVAVNDVTVEFPRGEFTTIVGPSGCGKTTILRTIAGLQEPTSGRVKFGDKDVTDKPPQRRNIAMVFQNIALYPHMTVSENIGYGLKVQGVPKDVRKARIQEAAEALQIADQLTKKPSELSGGQQQRVALGSAFVKDPDVLLFDEPMSDLDAKLKSELRIEIQRLHQELDTTVVYVTHDQTEAMTMSDNIITLKEGEIEQFDTPENIFHKPSSRFVADFIGTPSTNFIEYQVTQKGDEFVLTHQHHTMSLGGAHLEEYVGDTVTVGIRPQYMSLTEGEYSHEVTVEVVEPLGTQYVIHATTDEGTPIDVMSKNISDVRPGDTISARFDKDEIYLFNGNGETIQFGDRQTVDQSV